MATWIGSTGVRMCGHCGDVIPKEQPVALLCGSLAMARCQRCAHDAGVPFDTAARDAVKEWNLDRELRETREDLQRQQQASSAEAILRGARPAQPVSSFSSMADLAPSIFDHDFKTAAAGRDE